MAPNVFIDGPLQTIRHANTRSTNLLEDPPSVPRQDQRRAQDLCREKDLVSGDLRGQAEPDGRIRNVLGTTS